MFIVPRTEHVPYRVIPGTLLILALLGGAPSGTGAQESPSVASAEAADPSAPITGPRDLLARHGVDESYFEKLSDGRPLDREEADVLLRIMYWLDRFAKTDLKKWTRENLDLAQLQRDPAALRGEIFPLSGRVTRVEIMEPSPKMAERLDLEQFYRCEFRTEAGQPAVIFTRTLPKSWQAGGTLDQRASAHGLFLKLGADDSQRPTPVFLAPRVAWHPDNLLGNLGMDTGLLDDVQNRRRLGKLDREAFYQMLAAAGRAEPGQLLEEADAELKRLKQERFSVFPLFLDSKNQIGKLFALTGSTRRVAKIRVEDPDIVERFGIDHYYEMAVYTEDSQDNPVWFCVRELPRGMPVGEGAGYGEHVRVAGFFFKQWVYRSRQQSEGGQAPKIQPVPLLIGRKPIWYKPSEPATHTTAAAIAGAFFLLALGGIWLAVWRFNRSDKESFDRTVHKAFAPDAGVSLDEIGLDAEGEPDFSGLEQMEREASEE